MAKEKREMTIHECAEVGERCARGFEKAVKNCPADLDRQSELLLGIRGALGEVRADTDAGWMYTTLGRALAHLGAFGETEE